MLIPRFTIRWLLMLTTVCAVFFAMVALALRGHFWALGMSLGVGSLIFTFACYGGVFGVAYVLASLAAASRRPPSGGTPFATAAPPPQIIPPEEPE
jgi:hypothetical protein